jgi:lipopolysaccharide transport system permease protein
VEQIAVERVALPVLDVTGSSVSLRSLVAGVWSSRDLIATMARREFFAKYRRASLGVVWAVILPLLQAVVLAVVFTRVGRVNLPGNPFVFVFSGMAAWSFFTVAFGAGSTAIVDNAILASQVYFPRISLPLIQVITSVYLAVVNIVIVLIAAYATGATAGWRVFYLVPAFVLMMVLTAVASALFAALHVYFRDVRYIVQASLIFLLYLTPVVYPLTEAPHALRIVADINPMTGVIELYREATVGADPHWLLTVGISGIWIVVLSIGVSLLYCRFERVLADLL